MRCCELRRTPAVDGVAHVLFNRDQNSEKDEDTWGVLPIQPVNEVVIIPYLELLDLKERFQ